MNTTLHHKTIKTTTERITIRSRINRCNLITDRMRKNDAYALVYAILVRHDITCIIWWISSKVSAMLAVFNHKLTTYLNYEISMINTNTNLKYVIFFLIQEKFFYFIVCYHMLENSKKIVNNLNVDHVQNNVELFSCTM